MADNKERLEEQIQQLNSKLTGDMFQDMEIQEQIFALKRQISEIEQPTVRPEDSNFECFGCGS